MNVNNSRGGTKDYDVIVVGAGFSGLYALYRLRGLGFSARVLERGSGVGGTWFWNRYPGARCDIESVDYCYSFSEELLDEWTWTERYAAQPEILRYLNHVADRFDLRRDIQLDTEVRVGALRRRRRPLGGHHQAAGALHRPLVRHGGRLPVDDQAPGLRGPRRVRGRLVPHRPVAGRGRRLQRQAGGRDRDRLDGDPGDPPDRPAGRRSCTCSSARRTTACRPTTARSRRVAARGRRNYARAAPVRRAVRRRRAVPGPDQGRLRGHADRAPPDVRGGLERGGINSLSYAFTDFFSSQAANSTAAEFARQKIREIVRDPEVAEALCPYQHIGTKRTCVDIDYFETYNRDNVHLVDLRREPIERLTACGVRTDAAEYEVDCIVFAIGFDAMTGALLEIDIRGRRRRRLREHWGAGPRTYLGLAVAGFPNMFMVTGPGSPSVLSNMVVSIEQHVDWISDCIETMRGRGVTRVEATAEAEQRMGRST